MHSPASFPSGARASVVAAMGMQRLARLLLIVVGVFVLAVGGLLVARSRTSQGPRPDLTPSRADLTVREVRLQEESGRVRWRLRADQASVFEGTGRTTLRNVELRVEEPGRTWTLVAEEGEMQERGREDREVEARKNVVLTSDDGLRLETSVLRWQQRARRIWTDAPVRITREGSVVEGRGLDVDMTGETTTIAGPVRATFDRRPRR